MLIITRSTDDEGKCLSQMRMFGYEQKTQNVLRCCMKTMSDGDTGWKVVPCLGAGNWESSFADCRDTN